jgi:hypothetical protein
MRTAFAIAAMLLAACSSSQPPPPTSPAREGLRVVEGQAFTLGRHVEFDFKGGTLIAYSDFDKPSAISVHSNDGAITDLRSVIGVNRCPDLSTCIAVHYGPTWDELIVSRDGRPWVDSELWVISKEEPRPVGPKFLGMSRPSKVLTFQGCKEGKIYSSWDLTSLMSVLEGEKSANIGPPPPSGSDSKSEHEVYVVGDVDSTRMPVCNWRHRTGLDKVLPAPKSTMMKLVPASEQTPQHIEVTTEKSVTIDWFANDSPLDRMTIKLPNRHSLTIKPRYGTSNCPDLANCEEAALTVDNTTFIEQTLDGQPMGKSKLWKVFNPLGGPTTYEACAGGTYFSGRNRSEVEAALAVIEKKSSPQQDMVLDQATGAFAPADVLARTTPICDWTERAKVYQKLIDAAKKAAKDSGDTTPGRQ